MRHSPRPKYPRGTSIDPDPPEVILKLSTTTMWNAWLPLHLEWTCTGYVPLGRREKDTARSAGGAMAAAADDGEADGLAEGEGDISTGDSAGADAMGMALEQDATAINDSAANPIVRAARRSGAREMYGGLGAASGE
jgi:hypothetical protein